MELMSQKTTSLPALQSAITRPESRVWHWRALLGLWYLWSVSVPPSPLCVVSLYPQPTLQSILYPSALDHSLGLLWALRGFHCPQDGSTGSPVAHRCPKARLPSCPASALAHTGVTECTTLPQPQAWQPLEWALSTVQRTIRDAIEDTASRGAPLSHLCPSPPCPTSRIIYTYSPTSSMVPSNLISIPSLKIPARLLALALCTPPPHPPPPRCPWASPPRPTRPQNDASSVFRVTEDSTTSQLWPYNNFLYPDTTLSFLLFRVLKRVNEITLRNSLAWRLTYKHMQFMFAIIATCTVSGNPGNCTMRKILWLSPF